MVDKKISDLTETTSFQTQDLVEVSVYNITEYLSRKAQLSNVNKFVTGFLNVIAKTGDYTATLNDTVILCNAASAPFTITLPAASTATGKVYHIKKTNSNTNTVTIDGNASETIDGETTQVISNQYDNAYIVCDGSNWHII